MIMMIITARSGNSLIATVTSANPPAERTPLALTRVSATTAAIAAPITNHGPPNARADPRQRRREGDRQPGIAGPVGCPERPRDEIADSRPKRMFDMRLDPCTAGARQLREGERDGTMPRRR